MRRKLIQGLAIGLATVLVTYALHHFSTELGLQSWEYRTWDPRVRALHKPTQNTSNIRLILLDTPSRDWMRSNHKMPWPWRREVYAPMLSFLKRGGAKSVMFDITYFDDSRDGISDDNTFATGIQNGPPFVSAMLTYKGKGGQPGWPPFIDPTDYLPVTSPHPSLSYHHQAFPIPQVATNSTRIGTVAAIPDSDSIVRRAPVAVIHEDRYIPSLALAGYLAANPGAKITLTRNQLLINNQTSIPLDKNGLAILSYRGTQGVYPSVNAAEVIASELQLLQGKEPQLSPDFFKDAYVIFGSTIPEMLDLKPTPLDPITPGVMIHATLLDNILSSDGIRDANTTELLLLLTLCVFLCGFLARFTTRGIHAIALFAIFLPLPYLLGLLYYQTGVWSPVFIPTVGALLALVTALTINYALEGKQKKFIKRAFSQYMNHAWVDKVCQHPELLQLGGEERELTIYFSDVQGFSSISESLTATELTALLNEYLTQMSNIIQDSGGTIDKYEGDAVIAFWNAPVYMEGHAMTAVHAALACQKKLDDMREDLAQRYGHQLYARAGLNTGKVVVGNMGSTQHFNYTFLGDAGNLAARLEGINKQFGTFLMISEHTLAQCAHDLPRRELGWVQVVGKDEPVRIYEPMTADAYTKNQDTLKTFASALETFYAGDFNSARQLFSGIAETDTAAKSYLSRCDHWINHPPENWKGYFRITEK